MELKLENFVNYKPSSLGRQKKAVKSGKKITPYIKGHMIRAKNQPELCQLS